MRSNMEAKLPLSPYRVLDLADEKGLLCGKVFADLGADVIKIEPPGGDAARTIGPFYGNIAHPERSLFWLALNAGKRAITLDLESSEGRSLCRRLATDADFLIESFAPGRLDALGLGFTALTAINPGLIFISISPFGQSGPRRDFKSTDIVAMAMGGLMHITGDPDRAPVRVATEQSYYQASLHAAMGGLIAHYHKRRTGKGQHVDVSMHEAIVRTLMHDISTWELRKVTMGRGGSRRPTFGRVAQYMQWPCKDGYVTWRLLTGPAPARGNAALVEWMDSEGMAGCLKEIGDWATTDISKMSQEEIDAWEKAVARFFRTHTKEELSRWAVQHGVPLYPANTVQDVVESPQLQARDFWVTLEHSELGGELVYPGPFCQSTEPLCELRRRAPLIGEHNSEVFTTNLGLSDLEIAALRARGVI